MIYFTADLHLGHESVIKLCDRPFSSVDEMDERLIENWNAKVKGDDTVYIVGDLMWKAPDPEKYLLRLKGKKILIEGNHDSTWLAKIDYAKYFQQVHKYLELNVYGRTITLCHYPMIEWRNSRKEGSSKLGYLIYGHIHNKTDKAEYLRLMCYPNALNAGADVNGFCPVGFDELVQNNFIYRHEKLKGREEEKLLLDKEALMQNALKAGGAADE